MTVTLRLVRPRQQQWWCVPTRRLVCNHPQVAAHPASPRATVPVAESSIFHRFFGSLFGQILLGLILGNLRVIPSLLTLVGIAIYRLLQREVLSNPQLECKVARYWDASDF